VKQQTTDWTLSVQRLRNYFFNSSGAASIEQIMMTSLVIGDTAYSAETIKGQFNAKDTTRMWAVIGDMLWGIIGALPTGGADWGFSIIGASVAAGLTYAPSNKYKQALNLEAADLDATIANTFCQGDAFLYGSHDQAVGDLGLLTGMDMAISANPLTSSSALTAQGAATRGRATWIYQQFAAMSQDEGGWTMAFQPALCVQNASTELAYGLACRGGATNPNIPCPVQRSSGDVCGTQNQVGAYFAFPISKDCQGGTGSSYSTSGLQNPAYSVLVQNLQANPLDMATPSWTFWEKPNSSGKPPGSNNDPGGTLAHIVGDPQLWDYTDGSGTTTKVTGTLGWHLPVSVNTDAKGCSDAIAMAWPTS
jgi:hypothetical protein